MTPLNPLDECEVCGDFATKTVIDDDGNEHGLCRHCYVTGADSDDDWGREAECFQGHRVQLVNGEGRCECGETIRREGVHRG